MKQKFLLNFIFSFLLFIFFVVDYKFVFINENIGASDGFEENHDARLRQELMMYADPSTGKIPYHIRQKELEFVKQFQQISYNKTGLNGTQWDNIGPWNVGGRTRAIAIDINDEKTMLAGGASGGIWKTIDGGQSWERKTAAGQLPNIVSIVQSKATGKSATWYAATGEGSGASPSGGGAYYEGDGMYKSTDNGNTWAKITKTSSGTPQSFDNSWDMMWNLASMPGDTADVIFAATYGNIYKSVNGGKTFTQARGGFSIQNKYSYYTDVAITSSGIIYAALSYEGGSAGLWRSGDKGKTWTKITPNGYPLQYERVVIGIAPSDEKQVYFLSHNKDSSGMKSKNFKGDVEYNSLWKYTDGTGFTDLSANLPAKGGRFGDFITQQGYDLLVRVKPDDPNTVFLGGMNLWRSTDAFTSSNHIDWIGGYDVNSAYPDFHVYKGHHPDQHNLLFLPSDSKKMISTCDGGIFITDDCTASSVNWNSLNNGYLSTQFYTVAMDHSMQSNAIIGGLQDNGIYFSGHPENSTNKWIMPFNGDGTYCYVLDGAKDLYVSKQEGKFYHITVDANGNSNSYVRIDPLSNRNKYLFVNPFSVDPNNTSRIYIPAGDRIWRNNDVMQIQLKSTLDSTATSLGWEELDSTLDSTHRISAISISNNPANILYYGTDDSRIFKLTNCNNGQPIPVEITGKNFPKKVTDVTDPYVSCIAVDPTDADKIICVFSNYNIKSLFSSSDGGASWIDVSGNLEQDTSGSGNGPSCRWAKFIHTNNFNGIVLATSTGVYSTPLLNGLQTHWTQQGLDNIGNYPCTMIDFREADSTIIVATHGAGIFLSKIQWQGFFTGVSKNHDIFVSDFSLFPNPCQEYFYINSEKKVNKNISVKIFDMKGEEVFVQNFNKEDYIFRKKIDIQNMPSGLYLLAIYSDGVLELTKKIIKSN